jgi:hypothetical protein
LNIYEYIKDKSVIVVGNNATALEKEQGELIDSYDIVVRFGKGIMTGYEKYLGTRTDIWVTGGYRMSMRDMLPAETKVLFNPGTANGAALAPPKYEYIPMYNQYALDALNLFYGNTKKRLSSGAHAGVWLVNEAASYSSLTFINFDFFTKTVLFRDNLFKRVNVTSSWHIPIPGNNIDLKDPSNHPAHDPAVERRVFDDIRARPNVHFIGEITAPEFIKVDNMAWDNVRKRL